MIPKKLHFVWMGTASMPSSYRRNMQRWKELHPDWEISLWTDATAPSDMWWSWIITMERSRPTMMADVMRCEVVRRNGGVYTDLDAWPMRPIDAAIEGKDAFVSCNRWEVVDNNLFGAAEGSPIMEEIVNMVAVRYCPTDPFGVIGGDVFRRIVARHPSEVHVFSGVEMSADPAVQPCDPRTMVIHSHDSSWKKQRWGK
jgi:mannosyltransferase OCH1-like enzyme